MRSRITPHPLLPPYLSRPPRRGNAPRPRMVRGVTPRDRDSASDRGNCMKRPAVFFDRDNTLIVSDGYLGDPDRVVLIDGAAEAVARVRGLGFAAVVFSNQSGVARGLFGEDAVYAVNHRLDE